MMGKYKPHVSLRGRIISYFFLSLMPLVIVLGLAWNKLISSESKKNIDRIATALCTSIDTIDASINAAQEACVSLFRDNRVKRHLKPISESSVEDRAAQVEIHSHINSLVSITDTIVESMLVYLDDAYVFSDGLYYFADCFESYYCFADYDSAFWRAMLTQKQGLKMLPATYMMQKRTNGSKRVIPLVYITRVSGYSVVAIEILSVDRMVSTMRGILNAEGIQILILDEMQREVWGDFSAEALAADGSKVQIEGEKYRIIADHSSQNGLQYYLAVPDTLIAAVGDTYLLFLMAACSLCAVAIALALCFSQKIYRPIQLICSSMDDQADGMIPTSMQEVSRQFNCFLSNYQEVREEERSLRQNMIELNVMRLLSGSDRHVHELAHQLECEYAFTDPYYQLCVVEVGFSQRQSEVQDTERINMQVNFRNDLTTYLAQSVTCLVLEDRPDQYICVINCKEEEKTLHMALEGLLRQLRDNICIDRMHICMAPGCKLKNLSDAYEKIKRTLVAIESEEAFILCEAGTVSKAAVVSFTLKDEMKIFQVLKSAHKEQVFKTLEELLKASQSLGVEQEKMCIHDLLVTGMRYMAESNESLPEQERYQGLRADVDLPGGIESKRELLHRFYQEITQMQACSTDSSLTENIKKHIQQHYASDLCMESIAQEMCLSVRYISKVFRDKTGRNLPDYINEVRIEHVKELLRNTDMNIASISEAAGIYSRSTLIRLFRKYEGVTPSEYRELVRRQ